MERDINSEAGGMLDRPTGGQARQVAVADRAMCFADLLLAQAEQSPDAIAIIAPGREGLTYRCLWRQVERTVAALNGLGIGRGDRVAMVVPNGPEMAAAFVAVSCAATSAPLNPSYATREFDFYLSDLKPSALILPCGMDSPARAVAAGRRIAVIELSTASDAAAGAFSFGGGRQPHAASPGFAKPSDVALLLHTSGTTGRPKMVPLTHGNLCSSAHNIGAALELQPADRCLNVMPLFHIHGLVAGVLSSLAAGASVICSPGFDASQFFDWLESFRPSWYSAVPTMHRAILEGASSHLDVVADNGLRFIRSSSAALPPRWMAELEGVFQVPVIESYGMTEAAHQIASNPLPPHARKPGSVGVAAGPAVAIMDEQGNLLPSGESGEIVIRGSNVICGYQDNPPDSSSAFVRGWFRTGDEGWLDDDGYLFISGRIREIINRGGEKVAPREVDEALMDHPAVAQVVTFGVPHPTLGEDVAAAAVLAGGASATPGELREFAFGRLAPSKVPSQVLIVDQIPKGPTGKLERISLADRLQARLKAEFVAPQGPVELALCRIWAEVLGLERVGTGDNFFALGGDSLQATRVVARVCSAFQVELPVSVMFRQPTVAGQGTVIEAMLIDEIESMSEEQVTRLVSQHEGNV